MNRQGLKKDEARLICWDIRCAAEWWVGWDELDDMLKLVDNWVLGGTCPKCGSNTAEVLQYPDSWAKDLAGLQG